MLQIGDKAPDFNLKGYLKNKIKDYSLKEFKGKWTVLFYYPADFTFVCPTEILAFQKKLSEFEKRNTVVIGCSVDSKFSH